MAPAAPSSIVRLSTRVVAPADRLSYASWILSSSLAPSVLTTATPSEYELEVTALELPSIAIDAQSGSPQRSIRARPEIRRTAQRYCFLVLVVSGPWHVASLTRTRFGPGDLIFYDSRDPLDCDLLHNWNGLNVQLSEQFVRKWVLRPAVLTGRNICRESQWGRLLASYVAQLAPEFVVHAPLPQAVLIDQLGALLALTAAELSGSNIVSTPIERSVRDQVHDHIVQRCSETSLRAEDVASSLNVSTRTLHRVLAACGETFGAMLIQARVDLAVRMLQSPALRSSDHGRDWTTRGILGRLPFRQGPAQPDRPDAVAHSPRRQIAPCQRLVREAWCRTAVSRTAAFLEEHAWKAKRARQTKLLRIALSDQRVSHPERSPDVRS